MFNSVLCFPVCSFACYHYHFSFLMRSGLEKKFIFLSFSFNRLHWEERTIVQSTAVTVWIAHFFVLIFFLLLKCAIKKMFSRKINSQKNCLFFFFLSEHSSAWSSLFWLCCSFIFLFFFGLFNFRCVDYQPTECCRTRTVFEHTKIRFIFILIRENTPKTNLTSRVFWTQKRNILRLFIFTCSFSCCRHSRPAQFCLSRSLTWSN